MDLLYLPDSLCYQVMRAPVVESAIIKNVEYTNRWTLPDAKTNRNKETRNRPCPWCKQKRKRTLATYIRGRRYCGGQKEGCITEEEELVEESNNEVKEEDKTDERHRQNEDKGRV